MTGEGLFTDRFMAGGNIHLQFDMCYMVCYRKDSWHILLVMFILVDQTNTN